MEQPGAESAAPENTDSEAPAEQGQLVASGFGQSDQYAAGIALVENTSDHGGQTVTVQMNFLDEAGDIITSSDQLESFAYAGQTLAVHVFADLGDKRAKVASVEPTLLIEDEGTFSEFDFQLEPVEATSITDNFGVEAKFEITNPTSDPLQDVRIGVACYDKNDNIVGGGVAFPELIPPNGTNVVTATSLTVSSKPASCVAYPSPGL